MSGRNSKLIRKIALTQRTTRTSQTSALKREWSLLSDAQKLNLRKMVQARTGRT